MLTSNLTLPKDAARGPIKERRSTSAGRVSPMLVNGKHTPGPWDDVSKYPEVPTVRIFAKSHYIGTIGNSDDPREQTEANARLIAAAPESCQWIRDLLHWANTNAVVLPLRLVHSAKTILDKVEGRS